LGGDYAFELDNKLVVPAGINVIDGRRIDDKEVDQIFCVIDREEVAVNINTVEDLKMARELFEKRKPRH
jgi:GTP:adenosylcobinamide-phosphate guanylyltransferase